MALSIKDAEAEALAARVAGLTGESKTAAVKTALRERIERLERHESSEERRKRLMRLLDDEIWPQIPDAARGTPITKVEREEILGYGPDGV